MLFLRLLRSETFRLMLAGFLVASVGLFVSQPGNAQADSQVASHLTDH